MKTLQDLRDLLEPLTHECVDDPEEILNSLACDAPDYIAALDEAIVEEKAKADVDPYDGVDGYGG